MQNGLKLAFLLLNAILLIAVLTHFIVPYQSLKITTQIHASKSKCVCELHGVQHDFCYRLPSAPQIHGHRFNCAYVAHLKRLELLSDNNTIDMRTSDMPKPIFVTAMSDNHYNEGLTLIANIRKFWPQQNIVVYNLGLSHNAIDDLKAKCLIELRDFPFGDYPKHVGVLNEYRWKPIIIAITVKEFGAVWYMDTSIRWQKDRLETVYEEINCRRNNDSTKTPYVYDKATLDCKKPAYLLHTSSGHGVFPTTHLGVYDFIPTLPARLQSKSCENHDAGFVFVVRTSDAVRILKWYVLCALEKNCMAPPGAAMNCKFGNDRFVDYANCHRYDQSIINLLLANSYDYNAKQYVSSSGSDLATVDRTAAESFKSDDFLCKKRV